jgi:hypothetical protein
MSWLSRVFKVSSITLRFSEEIKEDIKNIVDAVLNYYLVKSQYVSSFDPWKFKDPYSGQNREINIKILPESPTSNQIAQYIPLVSTIEIFPHNLKTSVTDESLLFSAFYNAISHEVAHCIDPKLSPLLVNKNLKKTKEKSESDNYVNPVEFDGYSKQIIEDLKQQVDYNPSVLRSIMNWLRTNFLELYSPINMYSSVLKYWTESDKIKKTDYIRKLKQRIYNEVIQGTNENVQ